ncbi:MAG: NUDIX domain-containing protein, partial [Planctomycetes bacterium]|nr:NUDIX domain-containing protein [Planctomycetota bacterium]
AHVLVFNSRGDLYLQKRSEKKDVQPGRWDTSVGGHLRPGETYLEAARREMREELGIQADLALVHLYDYPWRCEVESEDIRTYAVVYDGPMVPEPEEISEGRFWTRPEIEGALGSGILTPNFEREMDHYRQWGRHGSKP